MSLRNSLRVRGLRGTIQLAFRHAFNFNRTPGYLLSRTLDLRRYDREHGIETAGVIETNRLNIGSDSKLYGIRYSGASPWIFTGTLDRIPIDHRNYSFIDIGSGKGTALFLASEYPFKAIVGVEYAPELHQAACRNIENFHSKTQKCFNITSHCQDGGLFQYPEVPWVLFFNAPFDLPVWRRAAGNIAGAPRGRGKSYLIYMNFGWLPEVAAYVERLPFLKLIDRGDTTLIFEFA